MKNKGIVLIVSLMVMAVILVLTGVYFSSLLSEKRAADNQRYILQALSLSESGLQHAEAELRERIRTDLKNRAETVRQSSVIQAYITANDSLGFLRDYAYAAGDSQFSVANNTATLSVAPLALNTAVQGQYTATITVTANGNPTKDPIADIYYFPYNYTIDATGTNTAVTPNIQRALRFSGGSFTVTVRRDTFAKYALFTNNHQSPGGSTIWFTNNTNFTGPIHTNTRFSFANNPSGVFSEEVTQGLTTARFYNNGWPRILNADSNPPFDVPTFQNGFSRGVSQINLPSSVTQQDLKSQATGGQNDAPWLSGIYLPNAGGSLAGGIYVKGDASSLAMSVDGNDRPVYTITQGSNTKAVTVDYATNQTIVANVSGSGGTPAGTYSGIPDGVTDEGILIYDNGRINNFSGTVQSDTQVTVSSDSDIVINNNVMYQSYNAGASPDATGYTNLLGILTWNGNVRIGTSAPNDINIHGIVMAAGRNGIFTVDDYASGSPRGTATLLGGAITDFYGAFGTFSGATPRSGYGRNFAYDSRMLSGTAPPFFPYMNYFTSFDNGGLDNKMTWQDTGG